MTRLFVAVAVVLACAAPLQAQVAFTAANFAASANGATTRTIAYTPTGTIRGAMFFVYQTTSTDETGACDYGGTNVPQLGISPVTSGGEAGIVEAYFIGSTIPAGAQTLTCVATASTNTKRMVVYGLTSGGSVDTELVDSDSVNSAALDSPSVTLGLTGRASFAAIVWMSGLNAPGAPGPPQPLASWTERDEIDAGNTVFGSNSYDTIGTADVTAGWDNTSGVDEDAVMIAVAVAEVGGAPASNKRQQSMMRGVGEL